MSEESKPTDESKSSVEQVCESYGFNVKTDFPPYELTKEMLDKAGKVCFDSIVSSNRTSLMKLIATLEAKMNETSIHEHNLAALASTQIQALALAKECGLL